jgi:aspartyl-tRNA(Asn)/glutamyl-tRNA(Gln) amidotransferase subunit C
MKEKITAEIFNHMVELAALELNAEEAEYLRRELNNQLTAIDELEAVPLDENVKPAAHGVPYTPQTSQGTRADEPQPFEDPGQILKGAPKSRDGYFVVPDIPHEDLN